MASITDPNMNAAFRLDIRCIIVAHLETHANLVKMSIKLLKL